jgi:Cu2+-exporting ATPase
MQTHSGHATEAVHDRGAHGGAGHGGHGHVAMFRRRFWWSLLLSLPVVATSHMVMDWLGYSLDFPGMELVGPVLGTVIFAWAGLPFLAGGWEELRARQPGMMLLIAMAISVAYGASLATSLGWFDLEFWWELAALITIILLGHWQEMKALGQARSALAALAELLPDEAERITPDGGIGIAIGAGTDVAIESAGIVLVSNDPRGVVSVIRLSVAAYRKMIQNLAWAAGYNVLAIPLAAEPWSGPASPSRRRWPPSS